MVDGLAVKATKEGHSELFMQIMHVATKVPSKRTEQEHQAYSPFLEQIFALYQKSIELTVKYNNFKDFVLCPSDRTGA